MRCIKASTLALPVGLGVLGCQEPGPALPEPEPISANLSLWSDRGDADALCGGSLGYVSAHVEALDEIHGTETLVNYFYIDESSSLFEEICGEVAEGAPGCSFDTNVVTTLLPHEHELVHAVRSNFGLSYPFFEEGAAEVWGQATDRSFDGIADLRTAISSAEQPLPLEYYPVAGQFTSFLVSRHGPQLLVDLAESTAPSSSAELALDTLEQLIDGSVEDEIVAFEAAAWSCGRSLYRDDSIECAVARPVDCSLADDEGVVTIYLDLDCAANTTIGPRDSEVWSEVRLERSVSANLRVVTAAEPLDADVSVSFRSCAGGCEDNLFTIPADADLTLALPAGDYLLRATHRPSPSVPSASGVEVMLDGMCQ